MTAPTEPLKPEGVERRERIAAQLAGHIWTVYQTDGTAKEFPDWRRAVAIEATRVTNELIDALDNQLAEPRDDAAELRAAIREWSKANRACSQWVAGTVGNDEDELPLARLSRAERRLHALAATEGQS